MGFQIQVNESVLIFRVDVVEKGKMQTLTGLKDRTQWAIDHVLKEHNLKNVELSRIIGSKPDTIRKYRSKLSTPRVNFLKKFCTAFEVDFQWLYTGEGNPLSDPAPHRNTTGVSASRPPETDATAEPHEHPDWLDRPTSPADGHSNAASSDIEMSFQRLALLAGIKIDSEWIPKLSNTLGVLSWKISLSIYNQEIDGELIHAAENCGYHKKYRLVSNTPETAESNSKTDDLDTSKLLKIAEEVLQSNTIHSASLAMNIISLKAMSSRPSSARVRGAKAISISKPYTGTLQSTG